MNAALHPHVGKNSDFAKRFFPRKKLTGPSERDPDSFLPKIAPMKSLIDTVLGALRADKLDMEALVEDWRELTAALGPVFVGKSEPTSFKRGVLYIGYVNPVYRFEMRSRLPALRAQLLSRGHTGIKDIR